VALSYAGQSTCTFFTGASYEVMHAAIYLLVFVIIILCYML